CNESCEVPAASWDHNITVQENIRSPLIDISIEPLQYMSKLSSDVRGRAKFKCPPTLSRLQK
ncbi:hypothetical protein D4M78_28810, partial [Klebsiella variicola]